MDIDGTSADDKDGPKVLIDLVSAYQIQFSLIIEILLWIFLSKIFPCNF